VAHTELATAPGHPFYERLNEVLEAERFDVFVESRCARFYATGIGRPGLKVAAVPSNHTHGRAEIRPIAPRAASGLPCPTRANFWINRYYVYAPDEK